MDLAPSSKLDGRLPCGKAEDEEDQVPVSPNMLQALRRLCTCTKRARHDTSPYCVVAGHLAVIVNYGSQTAKPIMDTPCPPPPPS